MRFFLCTNKVPRMRYLSTPQWLYLGSLWSLLGLYLSFVYKPGKDKGGACTKHGDCKHGLACDASTNTCTSSAVGSDTGRSKGEACTLHTDCKRGLACDFDTLTCTPHVMAYDWFWIVVVCVGLFAISSFAVSFYTNR
jgi:hypothetical protein